MTAPTLTNQPSIPDFKTREELAEFWDTHDMSDYWDQLKPAKVRVAKTLDVGVTVRFRPNDLDKLRQKAQEKSIGVTTLIRMLAIDFLKGKRQMAI